jgi:hypothetical protein
MKFYTLIKNYAGPHTIAFFNGTHCEGTIEYGVQLPEQIDKDLCMKIASLQKNSQSPEVEKLITFVVTKVKALSLDQACLLVHYAAVMGKVDQDTMMQWLRQVFIPEHTLFTLAKLLLQKEEKAFFSLWVNLREYYPSIFWISFFSEQLWRAALYTDAMHKNDAIQAKQVSAKLPFAFMQRGWQSIRSAELKSAHTFIVDLDHELKNGSQDLFLDLFFLKFFSGQFIQAHH